MDADERKPLIVDDDPRGDRPPRPSRRPHPDGHPRHLESLALRDETSVYDRAVPFLRPLRSVDLFVAGVVEAKFADEKLAGVPGPSHVPERLAKSLLRPFHPSASLTKRFKTS